MNIKIILNLYLSALAGVAVAGPVKFECPQELPPASVKVESPRPGWTTFVGSPMYLSGAAPADGPPERLGILRGDDGARNRTTWTQHYELAGSYPEGKWLRCDYGAMGEVSLAMRLPDSIKQCTVTGRKGQHAGENRFEIVCR
ncbi:STY0301 family protein [Duganella callida]|uniref:DUF3757 domain-containing protein n=1 Tax=Duganella callida TaxID=2561932 RepID=A0A4Y9SNL8_9BURK|nr:STY0301 family protein [Duganella callida]TFW26534.1 hypothetical protein E4L98_08535 [Duganella callida]